MFNPFIKMGIKITKKIDKLHDVVESLQSLEKQEVMVGWPQETSSRKGETLTNPELAYIHTFGSPANNLPARPILQPAIAAHAEEITAQQTIAIQTALKGKNVDGAVKRIGIVAQASVQGWFTDPRNGWPPDKPATIARKKKKWSKAKKGHTAISTTLIDTGALRQAVKYVIRNAND